MQITVAGDIAALSQTAGECEELASNALENNPVYEPWMFLPALRAFAAQEDLRIVLLRERGVLAGLVPLQGVARYKGLPVRTLTSWRATRIACCASRWCTGATQVRCWPLCWSGCGVRHP